MLATVGQSDKIVVEGSRCIVRNLFDTFGSTIADGVWGCSKDISKGEWKFFYKYAKKSFDTDTQWNDKLLPIFFFHSSFIVSWNWIWDSRRNTESTAGVAHNNENVSYVSDRMQRGGKEITNCWESKDQVTADCTKRKIRS